MGLSWHHESRFPSHCLGARELIRGIWWMKHTIEKQVSNHSICTTNSTPLAYTLSSHTSLGGFQLVLLSSSLWGLLVILIYWVPSFLAPCSVPSHDVVFLVLMVTSVRSFYLEKTEEEEKGGQKVLNLISWGAFSLMSSSF
ncbi:hypothetical protein VNO80_11047 [Phaseolus coccineus]|uniref:Uncharacterized protein n=1 Tax=Phaseolus coccineus TaxID=3886 RepID=A0AAN9NEJ3_PHACN